LAQEALPELKDGQMVVFLGDSITHGGWFEYDVQLFYATRFPDRKIRVENAGISGATAASSLGRVEKDVLARKPDWVYIMFGMNDVGRHLYAQAEADAATQTGREKCLAAYKSSLSEMVKKIKSSGVAVAVLTPSPYDQYGKMATGNLVACNDGLARCAQIARQVAADNLCPVVDLHTPMTALLREHPESRLAGNDRVHPGQEGHMVMAYYLLQSQTMTGLVAKTVIDAEKKTVEIAENCAITELKATDVGLSYTYRPRALPFPKSAEYTQADTWVPWSSRNRELLEVKGLTAGTYRLLAEGKELGRFSSAQLTAGIDLAVLNTPQQAQSAGLREAVLAKATADRSLRNLVQVDAMLWNEKVDPADHGAADAWLNQWLQKPSPYQGHYKAMVETYRKLRNETGLLQKAESAQALIFQRQPPKPVAMAVERGGNIGVSP
jgi:lysophospholipase L1-like esterase